MQLSVGDVTFAYVEHGHGRPALVLHGAGVDSREAVACFEPAFPPRPDLRRIYPDLPGMGETAAPARMAAADDVLDALLGFADRVTGDLPYLLLGHSAGGYFAQAMAERQPARVAGLALICPLLPGSHDVPEHRPVVSDARLGDAAFREYFVLQTPRMLDRYERFVVPGAELVDAAALERIGARWELSTSGRSPYRGPTLVVAGRLDSSVGYAAAEELAGRAANATFVIVEEAGHALPHEQPEAPPFCDHVVARPNL